MEVKSGYETAVANTKQKKKEGESKKKEILNNNKVALDKQSKEDSKIIEASMNKLEQIKLESMKTEAKLQTEINTALDEAKVLKETLENEKEKYASYDADVKEWKAKQTAKHKEQVSAEKSKYKELEADYKEQAKSCEAEIKKAKKEIATLKDKLEAELKQIKNIEATKQKRTEAKGKMGDLQKETGKKAGELSTLKTNYRKLCEMGTPGKDTLDQCATMKKDIAAAEKDIAKIKKDISKLMEAFNAF